MLLKLVERVIAFLLYLGILISPVLLGAFLGGLFLFVVFKGSIYGYIFASISVIAGIGYGIYLAEYARSRMRVVNFISMHVHKEEK